MGSVLLNTLICWICDINLQFKGYTGTKLLSPDGEKPCYECFLEDDVDTDENEEEDA